MTTRTLDMANVIASDVTIAGDKTLSGDITFSGDVIPSTPLSHRNLIINGAMQVAQRGTSATTNGYGTVDRFKTDYNGVDENPTQSQHTLTSSDTGPYEEGFRFSFHLTNGNQTSGVDVGDRVAITTLLEAQDIANSGWDYTSSSSYITLSFWCKSSVAQNFYGRLQTSDGTAQNYPFETGSLVADTWTKITKTIPGNSNLQFDNDNNVGLTIDFYIFLGTNKTGTITLDAWGTYDSSIRVPDMTSTWYTTNDATWEITGVQLERGSVATPFEHRTYADELAKCQRYFEKGEIDGCVLCIYKSTQMRGALYLKVKKRAQPTGTISGASIYYNGSTVSGSHSITLPTDTSIRVQSDGTGYSAGNAAYINDVNYTADAEL